MSEPFDLTVAAASSLIHQGALSPVALMESLLGRIDALEPRLKAWVTLDREAALEAAQRSHRELEAEGPRGPLHGIPVGIKDIFYTAGTRTTACSKVYAEFVPAYDATAVARLREAGAIILGKTVTTEFATSDPSPTRNPWNDAHTPGGSSSGSAVAVATRMCPAALGSQTGGSTVRPAAYNGIVGLKPSYGRISRYGVVPVTWSIDTVGILVRTVEDAALLLQALAGQDPRDPASSPRAVPQYRQAMERLQGPPRIGLVREFLFEHAEAEVRDHTQEVAQRLAQAGAQVQEVGLPPSFAGVYGALAVVQRSECASFHQRLHRERSGEYSPGIRRWIEAGMAVPAVSYLQAQRLRRRFRQEVASLFGKVDVLLTPATPSPAPRDLSTTGTPTFQSPWTFCGAPAIGIPSGLSQAGLPMGIQLVAAPFAEEGLLAAARWCESVLALVLAPAIAG